MSVTGGIQSQIFLKIQIRNQEGPYWVWGWETLRYLLVQEIKYSASRIAHTLTI